MQSSYFSTPFNYEDDTSDSISTAQSTHSPEEVNSLYLQGLELGDTSAGSCQAKRIRKKRCAYDKIDDDKRLQLLEAVHRGETLKSAAKRVGVNYSSAKSIFHTYRKEGRILKKAGMEKPLQICYLPPSEMEMSPVNNASFMIPDQYSMKVHNPPEVLRPIDLNYDHTVATTTATSSTGNCFGERSPSSPMKGLTETFGHLLAGFHQTREDPGALMSQIPNFVSNMKVKQQLANEIPYHQQNNGLAGPLIPTMNSMANQSAPAHSRDLLKNLDDFYMNYSNSPLSGGRGNMYGDCSDSSSRRCYAKEFDSFSDMVNALQTQARSSNEDVKTGIQIPRARRLNSAHLLQDKLDPKFKEESLALNETIGSAAMDTFKSFMDAQWLLCDALKKASYLNNLVQFQRSGVSPINGK